MGVTLTPPSGALTHVILPYDQNLNIFMGYSQQASRYQHQHSALI